MKNDPIRAPKKRSPRKLGWFAKPRVVRPGDKLDSGATIVSVSMSEGKCFPNRFYNHVHAVVCLLHFIGNLLDRYGLRRAHDYVFDFVLKVTGWYFDVIAHKYKKLEPPNFIKKSPPIALQILRCSGGLSARAIDGKSD